MNNLEGYTKEQLQAEIERREKEEIEASRTRPKIKRSINTDKLVQLTERYVDFILSDNYHEDNDYSHYIYEQAIEAIYGKRFWEWRENIKR